MAKNSQKNRVYSNDGVSNGGVTAIGNEQSINEEDIRIRAYELYEQKGGGDLDNWLEAERLIKQERGVNSGGWRSEKY